MGIEKYRVREVAKDFDLPTKAITEILTKYAHACPYNVASKFSKYGGL